VEREASALLVELGAIVLGLAVAARIGRRFGLSPIPLYLLAGMGIGEGGIHPIGAAEEFIEVGALLGVILLLLLLGIEYSAAQLLDGLRRSAHVVVGDFVLNFGPGLAAGALLGWQVRAALLLGGITYISSSGIIAKLLADLGRVGNRETPAVLTVLVTEDLVMAAYLPLMAALLVGEGAAGTLAAVATALGAAVAVFAVAFRFGDHVSRMVFSRSSEVMLLTLVGVTLLVAGLAERLQLSAAVGAFLVGIALSGDVASQARFLLLPLRNLFAAVFFVFFGLRVDPGLIPDVAVQAAALAVVTAATKIVIGWWAAGRDGVGVRGRVRAGTALVARGEFSIVLATIGAGIEPDLGALAAAYVLFLAVAGPVLTRFADPLGAVLVRRTDRPTPS
jgi:CPA2 family monovalent cation:H+ antiporter-2